MLVRVWELLLSIWPSHMSLNLIPPYIPCSFNVARALRCNFGYPRILCPSVHVRPVCRDFLLFPSFLEVVKGHDFKSVLGLPPVRGIHPIVLIYSERLLLEFHKVSGSLWSRAISVGRGDIRRFFLWFSAIFKGRYDKAALVGIRSLPLVSFLLYPGPGQQWGAWVLFQSLGFQVR